MTKNPFDEWLEGLIERGLDPDDAEEGRQLMAASPVRKERDDALASAKRYRDIALKGVFKDAGIQQSPEVLRIPDDLDVADVDKVKEWAVKANLIEAPQPTAEELAAQEQLTNDLAASDRVAAAAAGGSASAAVLTPETFASWPREKRLHLRDSNPEAFESLKRGEPVPGIAV